MSARASSWCALCVVRHAAVARVTSHLVAKGSYVIVGIAGLMYASTIMDYILPANRVIRESEQRVVLPAIVFYAFRSKRCRRCRRNTHRSAWCLA